MSEATSWRRRRRFRPAVEFLEARNLLNGTPANVLVNDPAQDTTNRDTQSTTAIVLGANSNIVVAFIDTRFNDPTIPSPTVTGYSLSTNGGASFTDEGSFPANPPYFAYATPVLARSNKTGTIFMSTESIEKDAQNGGVGERVLIFRSVDNGASFSVPINGTPGFVLNVDVADTPWIAVDNYPGPGNGNVYLTWRDQTPDERPKGMFFTRSTDDGLTWGPSGGVPISTSHFNKGAGANVAVGPDHTVYVFWWDFTKGPDILMRKSTDQGQTFGDPVIVTGLKTHGNFGDLGLTDSTGRTFGTYAFPQAAVNPVTGDIYVVYNDQPNGSADKTDIFFTESTDGGNKWSKPVRVNDDATNNDQWQPALAMTPDGSHVGIFWYDRRLDPADNLIDRFGAISTVSGHTVTFAPNFRITDVSFPPALGQDPSQNPTSMGVYDMATADNSYFYTTWGDNRLGDAFFANQPDVRFAKIPVGEDDAATATTLVAAKATFARNSATESLSAMQSLDPTLLVPRLVGPAPAMATTATPMPSSPFAAPGAAERVLSAVLSQTLDAPSLLVALDHVFAAAPPTQADIALWDALALDLLLAELCATLLP
jgi:hypothetical protein